MAKAISKRLLATMVAGLAALIWPSAAQANLIVNPGFESPDVASGSFGIFLGIPGWGTSSGDGIEIQDHAAGTPHGGDQLVELDSNNNSNMFQDVATNPGELYTLSFWYSPRPGVSAASNPIEVYWDGALLPPVLQASGIGNPDTVWSQFSYEVAGGAGANTRLEFRAVGVSESLGGYLDDVSVPEPGTLLLLGSGLTGLALRRRRQS